LSMQAPPSGSLRQPVRILRRKPPWRAWCSFYDNDAPSAGCRDRCRARGEFREEDPPYCAWIAEGLLAAGYDARNGRTAAIIERWSRAPVERIAEGASTDYLRHSGQVRDLEYILAHIDELGEVYRYERGQVVEQVEEVLLR
jgi:hypothetical protein